MKIVVLNHVTLDGVMQGPAGPDEDPRGGFDRGGWAGAGSDETVGRYVGERFNGSSGGLLLGRRSYEQMLRHWNQAGGPFKERLNRAHKYVASRQPNATLAWPNSTVLSGDVPTVVAALKAQAGGDLVIMGSGELIRSLIPHRLIDEFILMIHPIVLGSGQRIFGDSGDELRLELRDSTTAPTGVIIATYAAA
jgi:dihydrofolate reductase